MEKFGADEVSDLTKTVIEPMASDGLRTIGIAYKDILVKPSEENEVD